MLILILGCMLGGCHNSGAPSQPPLEVQPSAADSHYPISIENYNSKNQSVAYTYYKQPQRVIAVWQNSVETLLALGVQDQIVAVMGVPNKKYLLPQYQAAYEQIPQKSLRLLDLEHTMLLEPDLIVGWHSTFGDKSLRSTDFWNARNVNTYIARTSIGTLPARKLTDEYTYILDLGRIFDKTLQAEAIVAQMRREIEFVRTKTAQNMPPRALILERLGQETHVYGEKTLAGNILKLLGGRNLHNGGMISPEQLLMLDPEVIFLVVTEDKYEDAPQILSEFKKQQSLRNLQSVRLDRVIILPLYAIYSPGIRAYDGIKIMAQGLYPALYKE